MKVRSSSIDAPPSIFSRPFRRLIDPFEVSNFYVSG